MKTTKEIQDELKIDMAMLGVNQKSLSELLGVSQATISYELNKNTEDTGLRIFSILQDMKHFVGVES